MPSQEAYDRALALSHLILGNIYPAYLASTSTPPQDLHLLFPTPPPLTAGLITPLPAALTGDARDLDVDELLAKGVEAIEAVAVILGDIGAEGWAMGAR